MALIQVNFVSRSLLRTVPIQVILPVDKFSMATGKLREEKPLKTLYLLHGLLGNYTDWVTGTRIQRWAEERDLAVVMPSGDNSFYLDQEQKGDFYGRFIGEELVEMTRRMFPLSRKREDTFIAGLSMGGFGAIRNGLKYHETFGYIAGLSSAVHILENLNNKDKVRNVAFEESCFGPLEEAAKTDKNPRVLVEQLVKEKVELPHIYLACGTEDGLIGVNRDYRDMFRENGFDLTYYEGPGTHSWDFWDQEIKKVLDWLPLDDFSQGATSGSVGK